MSKKAKQASERIADDMIEQPVDEWVPDYDHECENCGETPVVTGVHRGIVVVATGMCGCCTWGEAACIDPAQW
ncbi:hypothetical protein AWB80_02866 [Caballeronia pedi]|uniref:Uncharacterized protein n=1 Tax=Caballeronia pedi TaxID=1777141 RepID=A0A158B045_9BURK|nr:hypothetical protein [Caballeronia pedi]SAK63442.1 hypothetical protein AWB80_02866 [Caballeronia pedi]